MNFNEVVFVKNKTVYVKEFIRIFYHKIKRLALDSKWVLTFLNWRFFGVFLVEPQEMNGTSEWVDDHVVWWCLKLNDPTGFDEQFNLGVPFLKLKSLLVQNQIAINEFGWQCANWHEVEPWFEDRCSILPENRKTSSWSKKYLHKGNIACERNLLIIKYRCF